MDRINGFRQAAIVLEFWQFFPMIGLPSDGSPNCSEPMARFAHHCRSSCVQALCFPLSMLWRCRSCRKRFPIHTGAVMTATKLGYRTSSPGIDRLSTCVEGISRMNLSRELGTTQMSASQICYQKDGNTRDGATLPRFSSAAIAGLLETCVRYDLSLSHNLLSSLHLGQSSGGNQA